MLGNKKILFFASTLLCGLALLAGCSSIKSGADTSDIKIEGSSGPAETSAEVISSLDSDVFFSLPEGSFAKGLDLCAADMYDDDTVELLYADPDSFKYKVTLYSLETGELTDVYKGVLATGAADYSLFPDNFMVINASPFIVQDIWSSMLYVFSDDFDTCKAIDIADWNANGLEYIEKDNSIFYQDFNTYSLYRYNLYTAVTTDAFTDTLDYQSLWLEGFLEDSRIAVFSGSRISDSEYVDVLVDLDTGEALFETTPNIVFYEAGGNIYVIREEENNLVIGLFDKKAAVFERGFEIELENYYVSMYVDQEEELLFICSQEDPNTYSLSCYDLADRELLYKDKYDISGYTGKGTDTAIDTDATKPGESMDPQSDPLSDDTWVESDFNEDYINLRFAGSQSLSPDADGILFSVASWNGLEDIVVWNLENAGARDESLSSSADWTDFECTVPAAKEDYGSNSEYAEALSNKYGVNVFIGKNAVITFQDYEAEVMEDEGTVYRALALLEKTLQLYPDGFFKQFTDSWLRGMCFYMVGRISPVGENTIDDPGGFAYMDSGIQMIVLNADYTYAMQQNICHEISHAIDKRLENMGYEGDKLYMDESVWASFNPEGFDYYYSYINENGESNQYLGSDEYTMYDPAYMMDGNADSVYFVDNYSKTYPTEDRARLMEMILVEEDLPEYMNSVHIQKKLTYYFSAIREAWDTTGWPEVTSWEEALEAGPA